jgi:BASS family bile acid:Na+ symporter
MLNKALTFYTRFFAVWVVIFAVVAYYFPSPFKALKDYNKWFFAVTMFGIGAVLCADDFKHILKNPTLILIGTCAQFTIMPFGAFALAKAFNLPAEAAAGLILAGAAPDAMAGNVMSYIAKADTAYAVSLTTVSTLACPVITLSSGQVSPRDSILGYAHRRPAYGHSATARRFCYPALLQKTG